MKVRDFNTLEFMSWLLSLSATHNGVVVLKLTKKLDTSKLDRSMLAQSKKQPMLGVTIKSDIPGFFKSNTIPSVMKINDRRSINDICNDELAKGFNEGEALLRLLYMEGSDYLVCVFHHIIGDAVSCIQFLTDLMLSSDSNFSQESTSSENFPDFLNLYPKFNSSVFTGRSCINTKITKTHHSVFRGSKFVEISEKLKEIPSSSNSQIIWWLFNAARKTFNLNSYNVSMPFNLRRLRNIASDERLSFYSSFISCELSTNDTVQDISKKTRKEFLHGKPMLNISQINECCNNIGSIDDFTNSFSSKTPSLVISSNKVINDQKDKIGISELLVFVSAQDFFSSSCSFTIQYGLTDKSISVCVSYPYPLMNEEKVDLFFQELTKLI